MRLGYRQSTDNCNTWKDCQSQNATVLVEHVSFCGALGSSGRAAGTTPRRAAEEQLGRQIAISVGRPLGLQRTAAQ